VPGLVAARALTRRMDGRWGANMLKWAAIFFIVSLVAGFFGFSGISAATAGIAKILFYVAIAVFVLFVVLAIFVGKAVL